MMRTESRGGHYRRDYPDADPEQALRSFITVDRLQAIENRLAAATMAHTAEAWLSSDAEVACTQ